MAKEFTQGVIPGRAAPLERTFMSIRRVFAVLMAAAAVSFPFTHSARAVSSFTSAWNTTETENSTSVQWADYDGDGDLDVLFGADGQANRIYKNNGGFGFSSPWASVETDATRGVAWSDFDADGLMDFAAANYGEVNRVYFNDGADVFTLGWSSVETEDNTSVDAGDFNADGLPDLAFGGASQVNRVYVFDPDASTFVSVWSSAETDDTRAVAWGDYDRDGDLDLAAGNYSQFDRVYRNVGDDTLTLIWSSTVPDKTLSVLWGDHNADGAPDLAVAAEGGINRTYQNVGGGSFSSAWTSGESEDSADVGWGDYDGDGDLDLVYANKAQQNRAYKNNGTGTFSTDWTSVESEQTRAVDLADYDDDGDLDFAAANEGQVNRLYNDSLDPTDTPPTFPSPNAVSDALIEGATTTVTLTWSAGTDVQTTDADLLTYDLRIGTVSGGCEIFCGRFPSSGTVPFRANGFGNVGATGGFSLSLATGTYYWSVRTADTSFTRSAWSAEESFVLARVFETVWSSPAADSSMDGEWGDFDGDGDLDLAVANFGGANGVFENAAGAVSLVWNSAESENTRSVAWGDYDGDGDLDLLAGNDGQTNRVYGNNGAGGLNSIWNSAETENTASAIWADLDGDGDLDIACANGGQSNRAYRNDGGGTFTSFWTSTETDDSADAAILDYDGDGDFDLLFANASGESNRIYRNDGAGSFTLDWSSTEGDSSRGASVADYDGDGDLDLAFANETGEEDRVYRNDGGGTFPSVWTSAETDDGGSADWGDYDNDGDYDLLIGNQGAQQDSIYENAGGGSFALSWSSTEAFSTSDAHWIDSDDDGDLDIAAIHDGDSSQILRSNLDYANSAPASPILIAEPSHYVLAATDSATLEWNPGSDAETVDSDALTYDLRIGTTSGGCDVFCGFFPASSTASIPSNGLGNMRSALGWTFTLPLGDYYWAVRTVDSNFKRSAWSGEEWFEVTNEDLSVAWSSSEAEDTYSADWGDYDADGDLDLLAGNNGAANRIYKNDGAGSLASAWTAPLSKSTYEAVWGDMDNDGDLDFVVANAGQKNQVFRNDGNDAFNSVWTPSNTNNSHAAAWADLDGDGDMDLAIGNANNESSRVYRNDGFGAFTLMWTASATNWTESVAALDADSDGDYDLTLANMGQANRLYRNNGSFSFSSVWTSTETENSEQIDVADYDGDGDSDVLAANGSGQANRLYANNGAGSFSSVWATAETESTSSVDWADYDGDGDIDFAAGNNGQTNRTYENNGAGVFSASWDSDQTDATMDVAWGDYDDDGDPDLFAANGSGTANRIHRNNLTPANTVPDAPTPVAEFDSFLAGGTLSVTLEWSVGSDAETADPNLLSYDLRVGTTPEGCEVFCGLIPNKSGYDPKANGFGNVGFQTTFTLSLEADDYYWSVRTVDPTFNRSAWSAEDAFTVTNDRFLLAWSSTASENVRSVDLGDVDGDGDLDFLTGITNAANKVYENDGTGQFDVAWVESANRNTYSVALGDCDGDGDLDQIEGNFNAANRAFTNDGSGTFSSVWTSALTANTFGVDWADYDLDGDLDYAAGNKEQTNRVYKNAGGCSFDLAWSSTETDDTYSIEWGDHNLDGFPDLAVGNYAEANRVYENQENDQFSAVFSTTQTDQTYDVRWGDYDRDGDLDLAIANELQANRVMRNNLGGSFTLVWSSTETDNTRAAAWGDYENDGDLDLIFANANGQSHRVYAGDGGGSFSVVWSSTQPGYAYSAGWGDFDGDGDLDLLVGSGAQTSRTFSNSMNPANTEPTTPVPTAEPDAELPAGSDAILLEWGASTDAETTDADLLTYDLRVGTTSGGCEVFCGTVVNAGAAPVTAGYGNAGHALSRWLVLSEGTYYWSVRAVDATFLRGLWSAEDSFTLIEPLFGSVWEPAETDNSSSARWGDFDGDGDLDIAVGNKGSGAGEANRVYENDGGDFSLVWTSAEAEETREFVWGDYDNDGDLDLAAGNGETVAGETNRVYRNDGGGTFLSVWTSAEADYTASIDWGDYDNDGDLDLAVGNDFTTANRVYRNDGSDSFTQVWSSSDAEETVDLDWADLDKDGDLDLAAANSLAVNRIYSNDGSDLFSEAWTSAESEDTRAVSAADYDADGDLDFAAANLGADNRIYQNGGAWAFASAWTSGGATDTYDFAWADYDSDGDLDLAEANYGDSNLVYGSDGAGGFAADWASDQTEDSLSADWGDYDGDGDPDLLIANYGGVDINRVYQNNVETTNSAPSAPVLTPISDALTLGATATAVFAWSGGADAQTTDADLLTYDLRVGTASGGCEIFCGFFDPGSSSFGARGFGNLGATGSHFLTLATGTYYWSARTVDSSLRRGSWSSEDSFTITETFKPVWADSIADTRAVAWGDMDADGDLDYAAANYGQQNKAYKNIGGGSFQSQWTSVQFDNSQTVAWGDADRDGDLDLAVGNDAQSDRVYYNSGSGAFPGVWSSSELDDTRSVAFGDYDNDGDLDLATGADGGGAGASNRLYENDGAGNFVAAWASTETEPTMTVAFADYDGDGDLDLSAANYGQADRVYRNDGGGNFTSAWTSSETANSTSAAWGDVDADGDPDLAVGADGAEANRIYRNDGGDSFTSVWTSPETDETRSVNWGDFDGDGDLDLLAANHGGQPNRIYRNDGSGSLTHYWSSLEEEDSVASVWSDMDDDGDLDVLTPNGGGSNLSNRAHQNNLNPANSSPSAPTLTGLGSIELIGGETAATATFVWTASTDAETSDADLLTYELRVGTVSGGCEVFCGHFPSGSAKRGTGFGAAGSNLSTWLYLDEGDYYWSVRAVDPTFKRGSWAVEDAFSIGLETTPPSFAGLESIRGCGTGCLELSWSEASDAHGSTPIVYQVFQATTEGGQNFSSPATSTQATGGQVLGLTDGQAYYFVVRAEDSLGNADSNLEETGASPMAAPSFQKHGIKPVLASSGAGFDAQGISDPSAPVFVDGVYYLWRTGDDGTTKRIGLTLSADLSQWTPVAGAGTGGSVLDVGTGFDASGLMEPSVIHDGAQFHMWYVGQSDAARVGRAVSDDGVTWTKQTGAGTGGSVFEASGAGFDADGITNFRVVKKGATYYAFYEGYEASSGKTRIGTATSPDGDAWTRIVGTDANGSVLAEDGSGFDADAVSNPEPYVSGSILKMLYVGTESGTDRIGAASSVDGTTWIRQDGDGTGGSTVDNDDPFDAGGLHAAGVLNDGGELRMIYETDGGFVYANTDGAFPPMIVGVTVSPDSDVNIASGASFQLSAVCQYAGVHESCGQTSCDCTEIARWTSSNSSVVSVGNFGDGTPGLAAGVSLGSADVTATVGAAESDAVAVEVTDNMEAFWLSAESEYTESVAWGDFDGDGDEDLAVGNLAQGNRVLRNDLGDFPSVWVSTEADDTRAVDWGDYDGDGDLDLVAANSFEANRVYRNDGSGSFTLDWSSFETEDTYDAQWGDFDNDGDLDFAAANSNSSPNRIYRNDGDSHFTSLDVFGQRESTLALDQADYDGDGDLDIAFGNWTGLSNRVYSNEGGGAYSNVFTPSVTENTYELDWGDYDADGDPDLLIGNWFQQNRVYRNDGGGSFTSAWLSSQSDYTVSVEWGDYDNDGDLDHVSLNNEGYANRIYANNGASSFTTAWTSTELEDSLSGSWSDFDGDGDLDLAVGNDVQQNRVYRNNINPLNSSPSGPSPVAAPDGTAGPFSLTWTAGADSETPAAMLTYDVRVGTTSGGCEIFCGFFPSIGDNPGGGRPGNAGHALGRNVVLDAGTYFWSARTVDGVYGRSAWSAEDQFVVSSSGGFTPNTPKVTSMTSASDSCKAFWSQVSGVGITYNVYRCEGLTDACDDPDKFAIVSTNNVNLSYADTTVLADRQYTYCAAAVSELGQESAFSDSIDSDCRSCSTTTRPTDIEFDLFTGWNLIGIPLKPTSGAVADNFDEDEYGAIYYESGGRLYDALAAGFPGFKEGKGYWYYSVNDLDNVSFSGSDLLASTTNLILTEGWNLVANPYGGYVDWVDGQVWIVVDGASLKLSEAVTQGALEGSLWEWDAVEGEYSGIVHNTGGFMTPWKGYWLQVNQSCELKIKKPE